MAGVQPQNSWEGDPSRVAPLPIHLSERDYSEVAQKFDYLVSNNQGVQRMVSHVQFRTFSVRSRPSAFV